jgi:hypothetical protein
MVDGHYTVHGNESWRDVVVGAGAVLEVPANTTLSAETVVIAGGSLEVDGGTVVVQAARPGGDAFLYGDALWLNLTAGARLTLLGADGNGSVDSSRGGTAGIFLNVIGATVSNSTIEAYGGEGFSNPDPWVRDRELGGYIAAGGNASILIGSCLPSATVFVNITGSNLTARGGMGGEAARGRDSACQTGGAGGGYSSGGNVSGSVGSGGGGSISLRGLEVSVSGSSFTVQGGAGGRAGDGGGESVWPDAEFGGGGGGGYSGGSGGGYQMVPAGPAPAPSQGGGNVSGSVGAGGPAAFGICAGRLALADSGLSAAGGPGGAGGTGGPGTGWCGGGGGGYGGGGGCSCVKGMDPPVPPNDAGNGGNVSGSVGAGGNVSVQLQGNVSMDLTGLDATVTGGNGGDGGAGGAGGTCGTGGGGGYGGGGGGTYLYGEGGNGTVSGRVGAGGGASFELEGAPYNLSSSDILVLGGAGGHGGTGGKGGTNAGGGGGGYGGCGGGGASDVPGVFRAGAGNVSGEVAHGGEASLFLNSSAGPGGLAAGKNTFLVCGGAGGSGRPGGLSGAAGGGGGGYAGGGGMCPNQQVPAGSVSGEVGNGGDACLFVCCTGPSLSEINSLAARGGDPGNGTTYPGGGNTGGSGAGRNTTGGNASISIPMSVPMMVSPGEGELFNAIPPVLEWERILASTTDGDVASYYLQVDHNPDFGSPEVDTGMENASHFDLTTELSLGGVYYWRVEAFYQTGRTAGYGPARKFFFNTPPVHFKNIPLLSFNEGTTGYHLFDLNQWFTDDLYPDNLSCSIIYESDPSHILGEVDGRFITFSTPTEHWYGEERFAVRATDPLGLWANSNKFTVRVVHVDCPPTVLPLPEVTVEAGIEYFFDLSAYILDPDTPPANLTISTDSQYVMVDGLAIRINCSSSRPMEIIGLVISDRTTNVSVNLTVIVSHGDRPPVIAEIPPVITREDVQASVELGRYVSDDTTPSGRILWAVSRVDAGEPPVFDALIVNGSVLLVSPARGVHGSGSILLDAIDLEGQKDSAVVDVTVEPVNHPPVIRPIPEVSVLAGARTVVDMGKYVYDPDTPPEDLRLYASSPLAAVDGLMLCITVPAGFDANLVRIPVEVSDGEFNASSEMTVRVHLLPVIQKRVPDVKTSVGRPVTMDLTDYALDRNSPPGVLVWEAGPARGKCFVAGIALDGHTLKITPIRLGKGNLTLTVRDSCNATSSWTMNVTVAEGQSSGGLPGESMHVALIVGALAGASVMMCMLLWARSVRRRTPR